MRCSAYAQYLPVSGVINGQSLVNALFKNEFFLCDDRVVLRSRSANRWVAIDEKIFLPYCKPNDLERVNGLPINTGVTTSEERSVISRQDCVYNLLVD